MAISITVRSAVGDLIIFVQFPADEANISAFDAKRRKLIAALEPEIGSTAFLPPTKCYATKNYFRLLAVIN